MSSKWRRFEVLLPLQFNDGREAPAEWLAEAVLEVVDHFGAASTTESTDKEAKMQFRLIQWALARYGLST